MLLWFAMSWNHLLNPPRIFVGGLPADEQEQTDHVNMLLSSLQGHLNEFVAALDLFQHSWTNHRTARWRFIAAKAAALEIYHFSVVISAIRGQVGLCPSVRPHIDTSALKEAEKLFRRNFPVAERGRHSVAHEADFAKTPEKFRKNYIAEEGAPFVVISCISDKIFETTYERQRIRLELSDKTKGELMAVASMIFDAIRPAARFSAELPSQRAEPPE